MYRLEFRDGSLLIEASFLEERSQVFRDLQEFRSNNPEPFDLTDFSLKHWQDYFCIGATVDNFPLIDRLHLPVKGVLNLAMREWGIPPEEIRRRVRKLPLSELQAQLPVLTSLDLNYGHQTLDAVVDLLGRSDEIFQMDRVYLPTPIPDQFWARLDQFLGGTKWRPSPQIILSGGALMTLLSDRDLTAVGPEEDLDLWIYGPSKESRAEVRERLVAELTQGRPVEVIEERDGTKITLRYQDGARTIQVLQTDYTVPSQIPNFFDLEHLKGYLHISGLFLHPMFVRALRMNLVDLDLNTIKIKRLLKCLRYDYHGLDRQPLWEHVVRFLKSGSSSVPHLPTGRNLWSLQNIPKITSKEQLIAWLQSHDPQTVSTTYPLSIREKALIVAVDDSPTLQEILLLRIDQDDSHDYRSVRSFWGTFGEFYEMPQPVVLRLRNIIIRKGVRTHYASFARTEDQGEIDNPCMPFLIQLSKVLEQVLERFKRNYRIKGTTCPLLRNAHGRYSLNLLLNILEQSSLTDRMRVDLDLQIYAIMHSRIIKHQSHVIHMKVLEHL